MEPQKESLNSNRKDKEIQIPGIFPLLKPVHQSPFLGPVPFKWYVINVSKNWRGSRRFYLNVSRHPKQLPKVLSTVLRTSRWRNWHTFFLLTPPREFEYWRLRYPMSSILKRKGADEGNPAHQSACRRKRAVGALQHQARKIKRLVANHDSDEARSSQLLFRRRPLQAVGYQREQQGVLEQAPVTSSQVPAKGSVQHTNASSLMELAHPAPAALALGASGNKRKENKRRGCRGLRGR